MIKRPKMARRVLPTAIALALLVPAAYTPMAFAQDDAQLEEIIVTGARGRPRTVSDSPVPIDVFSEDDLRAVSFTDQDTCAVLQSRKTAHL
jgi:iron complex outermembrane receptor protein